MFDADGNSLFGAIEQQVAGTRLPGKGPAAAHAGIRGGVLMGALRARRVRIRAMSDPDASPTGARSAGDSIDFELTGLFRLADLKIPPPAPPVPRRSPRTS